VPRRRGELRRRADVASCEACHGALAAHASNPDVRSGQPDARNTCISCHRRTSRTGVLPSGRACRTRGLRFLRRVHVVHKPKFLTRPNMDQDRRPFSPDRQGSSSRVGRIAWSTCWGRRREAPNYKARTMVGMAIDIEKCIGAAPACGVQDENDVPHEPSPSARGRALCRDPADFDHRSGVPERGYDGFHQREVRDPTLKMFYSRSSASLRHSPCVQCARRGHLRVPGRRGAGGQVVLLGCRYCVQACPYGCRFIDRARTRWTSAASATAHQGPDHGAAARRVDTARAARRPEGPENPIPRFCASTRCRC